MNMMGILEKVNLQEQEYYMMKKEIKNMKE